MIFGDFLRAIGQIGDPRFRRVMLTGVSLSLLLLVAIYVLCLWLIRIFVPETLSLPYIGDITGVASMASWFSAVVMIGLSVFLMMPVASVFSAFFLDDVAQAVEDRHYPELAPVPRSSLTEGLIDAVNFLGLLIAANLVALLLYPFAGPFIPVVFWAVNGLLLGREYFTLVAMRRLGRPAAKAMRQRHWAEIWLAGALMAAPLSLPIINLLIPVLGVATFTHLFHRLEAAIRTGAH